MITTIQELEKLYYGFEGDYITKADAPVTSSTAGVFNVVFGKLVWSQLNQEANAFGLIPKVVWTNSGWRLMTARAGATADGGVTEGGVIPDSTKPTFVEVTNDLKTVAHTFEVTEKQQYLAKVDDDATSDLEFMRGQMGVKHKESINQQLLVDVSAQASGASADYAGTTSFETLDRVISSDAEENAYGGTYNNYFDIFGLDRDAITTYDSYVSLNATADRNISDDLIRSAITGINQNGGKTQVILTGHDTYSSIISLYSNQVRFGTIVQEGNAKVGVNGIQTDDGIGVGLRVATLYGIPLIQSKDVPQDTISRVFFLDTSDPEGYGEPRISLSIAKPTQYFESGIDAEGPFAVGKFTTKGLYRTLGEIKCPGLPFQGKLRDLQ